MFDQPIFNPRDLRCKKPYGAVPSGTNVEFCLRPPRNLGYTRAKMTARFESRNDEVITKTIPWGGMELGRDLFPITLDVGDYIGLIWYSFSLSGPNERWQEFGPYQLTVYDDSEKVPTWYGEGRINVQGCGTQ